MNTFAQNAPLRFRPGLCMGGTKIMHTTSEKYHDNRFSYYDGDK
jgi:hypothetical protein